MKQAFTLIDVENGMFDLSLHTILTPPCFTFFWGIIQMCNRFKPRFKNPFTLTVAQAMAAGGGWSRQSIWAKQQQLNKVMVDDEWLIEITPGSRKDNLAAKYKINYNLIVMETVADSEPAERTSNIIDEHATNTRRTRDVPLTILRSDQKREEDPPSEQLMVVSEKGPPQPEDDDKFQQVIDLFMKAAPGWCIQNDVQRQKLISYCDSLDKLEPILTKAALKGVKGDSLFSWVDKGLINYDQFYGGAGGNSNTILDPVLSVAEEMVQHLHYCAQFPNRTDEIYPTLKALAEEVGRPLEELYAENDYLLLALDEYKSEYERKNPNL